MAVPMEKLYTSKELASLLNVSEFTIRKWIREDKIKNTMKFGHKTIRIPESSVVNFINISNIKIL
jgi:excisionase family DNA binding protein